MKSDFNILADAADDDGLDNHRNAPRPDPACLYGLVGDVARAGGDTTEANPYAIAANFIAFMGCAVGRGPYMPIGNTWHHARMFMLHIGRSGRGRKGDAVALIGRIERALKALSQDATPHVHRGGLSSREGLVFLIHDGYIEGKTEVEPILDKRLLVIESEFANILHQGKREGNTLSAALRDCWDGVSMKPATKSSRLWATDPHIAMVGAVTPSELLGLMASRELTNGFANRFLMFWAERTKMLAFPRATPQQDVDALAARVLAVLQFCQAERWADKDKMRVELSPDARKRYEVLYHSDPQAIRILLDRVLPSLRPVELPTPLNMPDGTLAQQAHAVVQAAAEGDIAPSQAAQIITALGGVAKIVETTELLARIEALESKHGKS